MLHPVTHKGILLFSMEYIHPSDCFMFTNLAEVDLGSLKILVSEDYF